MASYIFWPVLHYWYLRRKWKRQERERVYLIRQEPDDVNPRPVIDIDDLYDPDYLPDYDNYPAPDYFPGG